MSFGITEAGVISRQTVVTVETAAKEDEKGTILEETTYGGVKEVTEEVFSDSFTNEAVNGQTATTASGAVVEHSYNEMNDGYARSTRRIRSPLAAPA